MGLEQQPEQGPWVKTYPCLVECQAGDVTTQPPRCQVPGGTAMDISRLYPDFTS